MKTFFKPVFLFTCLLVAVPAAKAADVSPEQATVMQAIIDAQQQREHLYDNMHGVWEVSKQNFNGKKSEQTIEFWSREGKYYRVEWRPKTSDGSFARGTRVIVRPEGYVRQFIDDRDDVGTVIEVDDAQNGLWRVTGEHFYAQGNRSLVLPIDVTLNELIEGQSEHDEVFVSETGDGNTLVTAITDSERVFTKTLTTLDSVTYQCLTSTNQWNSKTVADQGSTETIDFKYSPDTPEIPISVVFTGSSRKGKKSSETQVRTELQLEPAAMEIFDVDLSIFDRPSVGWSWPRRIVVLLLGLALVGLYFNWRRKANA